MEETANNKGKQSADVASISPMELVSENFLVTQQLQRMPNLFARGLLYLVVLLVVVTLIYMSVCTIDIVVEAKSIATPASHTIRILSDRDGYADEIFVTEGGKVAANSPLFRIRSKEAMSHRSKVGELRDSIPLRKEHFDTRAAAVREELASLEAEHHKTIAINLLKLEEKSLSLQSIESDIAYWQKEAANLAAEYDDTKALYDKRLLSTAEYNAMKSRVEQARTQKEKLAAQKKILLNEKRILEEETSREKAGHASRRRLRENEMKALQVEKTSALKTMGSEMERSEQMLSLKEGGPAPQNVREMGNLIRTEVAGTVAELHFRNRGEFVKTGDLLCTIVPADGELFMDITVENKDIGFLEAGTEIRYKLDAFPHTDYGTLRGKVALIPPAAVENEKKEFVYRIKGSLEKPHFDIRGKKYPVKAGMTATAEFITERKSILSMLLNKFDR